MLPRTIATPDQVAKDVARRMKRRGTRAPIRVTETNLRRRFATNPERNGCNRDLTRRS